MFIANGRRRSRQRSSVFSIPLLCCFSNEYIGYTRNSHIRGKNPFWTLSRVFFQPVNWLNRERTDIDSHCTSCFGLSKTYIGPLVSAVGRPLVSAVGRLHTHETAPRPWRRDVYHESDHRHHHGINTSTATPPAPETPPPSPSFSHSTTIFRFLICLPLDNPFYTYKLYSTGMWARVTFSILVAASAMTQASSPNHYRKKNTCHISYMYIV